MSAAVFEERAERGLGPSLALSALTHLVLFAVLVFGVRWQNRPPETVSVELWEPPAPPRVEAPKPTPAVEPEPQIEKPEIAIKEPAKPKPAPKPRMDDTQKRMHEELAREQASLERQRAQEELASLARSRALADYEAKIRNKVRGNIVMPADLQGNPEAVFDVAQLPTGEVLSVKLRKSSGHKGYDDAVERAILKSSPLPKPERPELFSRELKLTFRPRD